jgi:hypothetical protein
MKEIERETIFCTYYRKRILMGNEFTRRGCIHHHNYRHLRLFYDYSLLYKNFVEAGIIRILEAATDNASEAWLIQAEARLERGKKLESEPQHWITISFEQFRSYLIVGLLGEKISEPTFKKHLKKLKDRKHVFQRLNPDPDPKIQNGPRQYLLNSKLVQKELDKQQKELEQFMQNLIVGTDESDEEADGELVVNTPPGGVKDYPSPKDLGGGKSLGEGQTFEGGQNNTPGSGETPPGGVKDVPREDTRFRGGRIQGLGEGGYKVDPPITNSNYNTITKGLHPSSPPQPETTDSDAEAQEEGEEISPLSENILPGDDDIAPTESRMPAVSRNGASSSVDSTVTQANKRSTPSPIPHRPTGETPIAQSAPARQSRCDILASKLTALRGYGLENEATVREQAGAIRQLVTQYSDDELAWVLVYTFRFSEQYRGMKPGPKYASVLLEVAPTAIKAAAPEIRALLMQQQQQSVAPAASIPTAAPPRQLQQPQQPDNPYSVAVQLAQQNNGRRL